MKILFILGLYITTLLAVEPLVSTTWLHQSFQNSKLIIIDVSDEKLYKQEHIPKSINSPLSHWRQKHGNYSLVKDKKNITKEFQRLGINKDSHVIIYSHYSNKKDILKASYIMWAMEYYGFTNTSMLDGGLKAWQEELFEMNTTEYIAIKQGTFQVKREVKLIADLEFVKKEIGHANMIDARPAKYYFGSQKQVVLAKAGHIPQAKSYFWQYSFEGDYIKDKALLEKMLILGLNLEPNKITITYCTGGLETSMNFFILHRILGFNNIYLYDASMKEWANSSTTSMTLYKWE